jgi:Flp pilus assembly protein TadG
VSRADPTDDAGQATVELVALLPLVLAVALTAAALVAGHAAAEQAGQAAQAGAMALIQGGDPRSAARRALPDGTRATIEVDGRRVTVDVRPRLPVGPVADAMTARVTADAGPEPP